MSRPITHGHGTRACYCRGCRCVECIRAAREHQRLYRKVGHVRVRVTHGLRSTYSDGCRCDACRIAHKLYMRLYQREYARRKRAEKMHAVAT